jgi:hypothetical protein
MHTSRLPDIPPEVVRQHGEEELVLLRQRVCLWRDDYIRHATPGAGEEEFFLCQEFIHEIEEYLYPYLRRLVETNHITPEECVTFMDYCYAQVLEVAKYLGLEKDIPH